MKVGLISSDVFQTHLTGPTHPERPGRLVSIAKYLQSLDPQPIALEFDIVSRDAVARVHDPHYIDEVAYACANGMPFVDSTDTPICRQSYDVALLAVGGVIAAVDAVMAGQVDRAFCAVRPPGHHAEHDHAMGFCLFNNIAIAAEHLIQHPKLQRVAIVDFDAHHGNGTQHAFESRSDVLFCSMHEHPKFQFPGMGFEHEKGQGDGTGYTVNATIMPGMADGAAQAAMTEKILPAVDAFEPQFLLLSAGFDALLEDPLGGLNLTYDCFDWMTEQLLVLADKHCGGRFVSVLEGGYNFDALAQCVARHVAMLGANISP